jgi:transmembrane 9 superfamily protein 2/4
MIDGWTGMIVQRNIAPIFVNLVSMVLYAAIGGVVGTFLKVSGEDYRWWWASFKSASVSGCWMFAYAVYFWAANGLARDFRAVVVYMTVMGVMSMGLALAAGAASFLASFVFVQLIYGSLKME